MSFPLRRDSNEWNTVTTSGNQTLSTNRRTGKTFSGTLAEFDEMMNDVLEGTGLVKQSNVPVGLANTGSVAANGALTLGTALSVIYPNLWLYFPAEAAYVGSTAGIYYCVMSSTTVGVIYNVKLTAGTMPYIPTSPAAIVEARTATAYTGATTIQALATVAVPGGLVGPNGTIRLSMVGSHNTSAGVKTYTIKGDTQNWLAAVPTTTTSSVYDLNVMNRGAAAINVSRGLTALGDGTRLLLATTVDTGVDFNVTFNGTVAVATDTLVYEHISIGVSPKL